MATATRKPAKKVKKMGPLYRFFEKRGWCQGVLCVARNGKAVEFGDKRATGFCLNGAALAITHKKLGLGFGGVMPSFRDAEPLIAKTRQAVEKECGMKSEVAFNNQPGMTKRKIMAFLRKYGL